MKKHWKLIGFLAACAMVLVPLGALADSISPSTVTILGNPDTLTAVTIHKTVTVSAGTPTTAQTDIMFLSDTTGSMGGTIATVQAGAAAILGATASLGNVQWAVGDYKDVGDPYVYRLDQAMTANQAAVQAGINTWVASGGGDTPEANLYAIQQSTLAATGWRAGSARILVQFGDAPGHDPSGPTGVTLAQATAALVGPPVTKLIAVDVGAKDSTGQETFMVNALNGVSSGSTVLHNPSPADLINAVTNAITTSFSTYHTVSLAIVPLIDSLAPVMVSVPSAITGTFTRDIDRFFDFDITLVGCCRAFGVPEFDFDIQALVDGVIVAVEHDHWTCVPVPPSMILMGSGLLGLIGLRRFKRI